MKSTPPGNENGTCTGIYEYENARPKINWGFLQTHTIFFVVSLTIWMLSLIWLFIYRKHRQLAATRPFFSNLLMCLANMVFSIALLLNVAIPNLPCGIFLASLIGGIGGCGAHLFLLLTIFILESNYAQNIGNYGGRMQFKDTQSVGTTWYRVSVPVAMQSLFLLMIGRMSIQDLSLEDSITLKSSYWTITIMVLLPIFIPMTLIIIIFPVYRECLGCGLFLEPLLGFLCIFGIYLLGTFRMLWIAKHSNFCLLDSMMQSIRILLFLAIPPAILFTSLFVLDVEQKEYRREFMYFEWGWIMVMHVAYWGALVGSVMWRVYFSPEKVVHEGDEVDYRREFQQFMYEIDTNYQGFTNYLIDHHAVENLYFVQDVTSFKRACAGKEESWKRQKATMLTETYLRPGSVMEINVSSAIRNSVRESLTLMHMDMETVFDLAMNDLIHSILYSHWCAFSHHQLVI